MMTFFVDPRWRRDVPHTTLLYPFWGNAAQETHPFLRALFERHQFDTTQYALVEDISAADMVLLPYSYTIAKRYAPDLISECAAAASRAGKPLLIDGASDIEEPITIPRAVVLRFGGYRFEHRENEIHIPFYADDLLEAQCDGELQLREKSPKPSVAFAGWSELSRMQALRSIVKELPDRMHGLFDSRYRAKKKGVFFRAQALRTLARSPLVDAHVIERASYSAHTDTLASDPARVRKEFVDNLLGSDYGLEVRGDANASIRLFEILSLGRIPVIIDTERNFPFEDELEYAKFSLKVDFRDIGALPERIAAFHKSLSDEQFVQMQKDARAAYLEYFRVDALTRHLMAALRARIAHD